MKIIYWFELEGGGKVREAPIHDGVAILECELSSDGTWWLLVESKGVVR